MEKEVGIFIKIPSQQNCAILCYFCCFQNDIIILDCCDAQNQNIFVKNGAIPPPQKKVLKKIMLF